MQDRGLYGVFNVCAMKNSVAIYSAICAYIWEGLGVASHRTTSSVLRL